MLQYSPFYIITVKMTVPLGSGHFFLLIFSLQYPFRAILSYKWLR